MKMRSAVIGTFLFLNGLCLVDAATLFTSPIIFVQPSSINFGTVERKAFATNSFLVENVGGGTLVGKAEVAPPFKIVSGGTYKLKHNAAQLVTVVYTPDNAGTNIATVKFTGGDKDVTATVKGKLLTTPPWYRSKRK
jgi:hypothetical protein